MPKKTQKRYKCPICGLVYAEKKWAKKCEAYCSTHDSSSKIIAKHAIK